MELKFNVKAQASWLQESDGGRERPKLGQRGRQGPGRGLQPSVWDHRL